MDNYQKNLYDYFSEYRQIPTYPTYPPYHKGEYLEDYFIEKFTKENDIKRYLIPVSWTTCYVENKTHGLQEYLNNLDKSKSYFTVAQHDDAIREKLPPNTICFNSGGNGGGIPIPLICSPLEIPKGEFYKDIFCSFVGSLTHPIRNYIYTLLCNNPKYYFKVKTWTPLVDNDDLQNFIDITLRSKFVLVPRGYGKSSFRLYEVMQLGAIPVFIYDEPWFPFEDELDWDKFSVRIHVSNINKIDEILSSISDEKIRYMCDNMYITWKENFTMDSVYNKIICNIK